MAAAVACGSPRRCRPCPGPERWTVSRFGGPAHGSRVECGPVGILTAEDRKLLSEPQLAHVATIAADGSPHVTPVWVDVDDDHILLNTAKGRVKYRNLVRDPRIAISIADKANDYRTLCVKGTAELIEEGADPHIDKLAKKYLDADSYPFRKPGEVRVIVRVTPTARLAVG